MRAEGVDNIAFVCIPRLPGRTWLVNVLSLTYRKNILAGAALWYK